MSYGRTIHVVTPTYKPLGGVIKIMDYATHAVAEGFRVALYCKEEWQHDLPLFQIERFRDLHPDNDRIHIRPSQPIDRITIRSQDLAFVSLPTNVVAVERALAPWMSPERIIHIVQGFRHATPDWMGGYPTRLLTRPMARIAINQIVMDRIRPYLDERAMSEVIPLGHDLSYFRNRRADTVRTPVRVAYTTWKSDLGIRLEGRLPSDSFEVRSIREHVSWQELRELYQWADVFLCTPGPEEGFYLPGLEAMAAGALVVTPDVGGNMAYCRPGENCELVGFEDLDAYEATLHDIATWSSDRIGAMRRAGLDTTAEFDLMVERRHFAAFLRRLWERIEDFEKRTRQGIR